jgi:hypothetical protein
MDGCCPTPRDYSRKPPSQSNTPLIECSNANRNERQRSHLIFLVGIAQHPSNVCKFTQATTMLTEWSRQNDNEHWARPPDPNAHNSVRWQATSRPVLQQLRSHSRHGSRTKVHSCHDHPHRSLHEHHLGLRMSMTPYYRDSRPINLDRYRSTGASEQGLNTLQSDSSTAGLIIP